jgi:CheY-like chemotaxis protein
MDRDKRRHPRAAIRGVARIAGDRRGLLAVRDLSTNGLRLTGRCDLPIGAEVRLHVRLFGEPFDADGRVAWIAEGTHPGFGVELADDPEVRERCDEADRRIAGRPRRGAALLVEADRVRAALLAEYLWSHGYEVEEVPAPLSAIQRLAAGSIDLVAIGPALSTCSGAELATFVAENFPHVHRMVVAGGADDGPSETRAGARTITCDIGKVSR